MHNALVLMVVVIMLLVVVCGVAGVLLVRVMAAAKEKTVTVAPSAGTSSGARIFVSRIDEERSDKTAWRRAFFYATLGYPVLVGLVIYFAQLPRVLPFMLERDASTGIVTPLGPISPMISPVYSARRAALGQWFEELYTVTDVHSQSNFRDRVFAMIKAGSQAEKVVSAFYGDPVAGPDAMRKHGRTYAVTVDNITGTDNEHFDVDYTLRVYDDENQQVDVQSHHATITLEWHPEATGSNVLWLNPNQLFITQFRDQIKPTVTVPGGSTF